MALFISSHLHFATYKFIPAPHFCIYFTLAPLVLFFVQQWIIFIEISLTIACCVGSVCMRWKKNKPAKMMLHLHTLEDKTKLKKCWKWNKKWEFSFCFLLGVTPYAKVRLMLTPTHHQVRELFILVRSRISTMTFFTLIFRWTLSKVFYYGSVEFRAAIFCVFFGTTRTFFSSKCQKKLEKSRTIKYSFKKKFFSRGKKIWKITNRSTRAELGAENC